jgi:hypothetical protein
MSPSDRVVQLYPQAVGSIFFAFYNSLGCGGGILTRLHTGSSPPIVGHHLQTLKHVLLISYCGTDHNENTASNSSPIVAFLSGFTISIYYFNLLSLIYYYYLFIFIFYILFFYIYKVECLSVCSGGVCPGADQTGYGCYAAAQQ